MNKKFQDDISLVRKEMARKSLRYFAATYFKPYLKYPFAKFHLETMDYLQAMTFKRNGRFALAAPRGYAKSSIITLIYVLWCICFKFEQCIVLVSSTKGLCEKYLSHVKDELSGNELLKRDFSDVCEPPNPRWRANEIITKNNVNVIITSISGRIRGFRYKAARPGLVILDDVENHENVRTSEGREKVFEAVTRSILNLGHEKTNYIVCGTLLHFDSLLAKIINGDEVAGWDSKVYKAIINMPDRLDLWDEFSQIYRGRKLYEDQSGPDAAMKFYLSNKEEMLRGAKVLWEERESLSDLFVIREQRGEAAFLSEKMNEPRAYETIDMKNVEYWDSNGRTINDLLEMVIVKSMIEGACDPAVTVTCKSDYSAVVTAVRNIENQDLYVVSAEALKVDLDTLVKKIAILHEIYTYTKFVYEANAAQLWLGEEIKKQIPLLPLKPIVNTEPKEVRITRLLLFIKQGKVKLSKKLTALNRQLSQYPYCAHDDLIDALSILVSPKNTSGAISLEQMKKVLDRLSNPPITGNPKKIIMVGGKHFNDPFGLLSA